MRSKAEAGKRGSLLHMPPPQHRDSPVPAPPGDWKRKLREFVYGMYGFEFEIQARELRGELETAFLLLTMGDMLGVPIMPPLYALRILPYATPTIESWKHRVMRERDLSDKEEFHLHGV